MGKGGGKKKRKHKAGSDRPKSGRKRDVEKASSGPAPLLRDHLVVTGVWWVLTTGLMAAMFIMLAAQAGKEEGEEVSWVPLIVVAVVFVLLMVVAKFKWPRLSRWVYGKGLLEPPESTSGD